jgi:hypothetical protein
MAGYEITWSLPATKTIFGETSSTGGSTPVSGHCDPSASLPERHHPCPRNPDCPNQFDRENLIEMGDYARGAAGFLGRRRLPGWYSFNAVVTRGDQLYCSPA